MIITTPIPRSERVPVGEPSETQETIVLLLGLYSAGSSVPPFVGSWLDYRKTHKYSLFAFLIVCRSLDIYVYGDFSKLEAPFGFYLLSDIEIN